MSAPINSASPANALLDTVETRLLRYEEAPREERDFRRAAYLAARTQLLNYVEALERKLLDHAARP